MQVNQVTDHVSHAVIGNKVAREAQISSSAEFFNVLSNTLYSDKMLAVIREVLCNAWDIHIQQGITDKPVEITLTDTKLTIRDFGTGIHDDQIVDVYLTYGNSTKKLDGTQTGGFGLGSKAPWAYVDHFEVTSFHAGTKTIYAMSKSSGEVAGKPSALPILSVPTEETGLQVSLAVANYKDSARFGDIIKTIVKFGEMNVVLNEQQIETIAFSEAKHGFLMIDQNAMTNVSGYNSHRIFIRYGNVVYPLPSNETLSTKVHAIQKLLDKIAGNTQYHYSRTGVYNLILQAKPDTISVTPSRESLSMTDHSVKNISILLDEFNDLFVQSFQTECLSLTEAKIKTSWINSNPAKLLTSDNLFSILRDEFNYYTPRNIPAVITTVESASKTYLNASYPSFRDFREKDVLMRLKALERSGFGNRGKIQSFRREYENTQKKYSAKNTSDWFQRVLVAPLMRKLNQVPELSGNKLLVRSRHQPKQDRSYRWRNEQACAIIEATKLSPRKLEDYMPFLRNFVVLSYNRIDIDDRLSAFPIMKFWFGSTNNFFCYIVSRTKGKAEIAKAFFESQGMTVVDLTQVHEWEPKEVIEPVAKPVIVKPRKKGLPKLSSIIDGSGLRHQNILNEECERIEDPQFIVKMNPRAQTSAVIPGLSNELSYMLVKHYGHLGGIAANENQYARFLLILKIPPITDWFFQELLNEFLNNQKLQIALSMQQEKVIKTYRDYKYDTLDFYNAIIKNPELSIEFNILNELNQKEKDILLIIDAVINSYNFKNNPKVKELISEIDKLQVPIEAVKLFTKLNTSRLITVLSSHRFSEIFGDNPTEKQKLKRSGALDLLMYAIEG